MCLTCYKGIVGLAQWDADYVNNLPDEAFAVIEPDYVMGRNKNKNARHLPHHEVGVNNGRNSHDLVDKPHLQSALKIIELIEPVTASIGKDQLVRRAKSHLMDHAGDLKVDEAKEDNKDSKQNLVYKPSSTLIASLSERGFNIDTAGKITSRIDGTLLSVDSKNIQADSFQQRLAERQDEAINAEYFKPKPEDFITAEYRALSKHLLPRRFLDFTKSNVLKNSAKMLQGVTFYSDHIVNVENWLGNVKESYWDEDSKLPGINAKVLIDAYANPKITRGILAEALSRVSVGVWFAWEKSHDLDDEEFINLLGSNLDDEIVRFIITKIEGYGEMSLVWYGADPTAKQRGNVKIGNE